MLKILDDNRPNYDKDFLTILVLLDFSKAFDVVKHEILLKKLEVFFNFSQYAVDLMKNYLVDRTQKVLIGNEYSLEKTITTGVPQGSILGPILFSMFINDISNCCKHSLIHLYADDVQLYMSRPIGLLDDLIIRLNEDLSSILQWTKFNCLNLNVKKTKVLPISHSAYHFENAPKVKLGNIEFQFENSIKNLGFLINRQLTPTDHVDSVVNKIFCTLRKIWYSKDYLSNDIKLKLVRTLIVPIISYSETVYGNLNNENTLKIQNALNSCARFIFNKRKYDHILQFSDRILNCSITRFYDFLI